VVATRTEPGGGGVCSQVHRRPCFPVVGLAILAVVLCVAGVRADGGLAGAAGAIRASRAQLVGPAVLAFVALVFALERRWPAQPRPVLARGHVHDAAYLGLYAMAVVPVITLTGTGFSAVVRDVAPWIVLPRMAVVPRWVFVVAALVAMDGANWFAHWANHRVDGLWRLHAVHHTQPELSVLTSFRAHPLVHVSFLVAAVPALVLLGNGVVPAQVILIYICLASLPHANLAWGSGRVGRLAGRVVVTPASHRLHHADRGRIDVNLGTILSVWDAATHRAVWVATDHRPPPTGLAGHPIPIEQDGPRPAHLRTLLVQLVEPFVAAGVATGVADPIDSPAPDRAAEPLVTR
jgi:sterol desaturase/sphingolipid hydroxylase (fatty acid hydroxylase superfamily)